MSWPHGPTSRAPPLALAPVSTTTRDVAPRPAAFSPTRPDEERGLSWAASALVLGILAAILLSFYLSIYPAKGYDVPIGWDVSEYLWRTKLAQEVGLQNLGDPLPSSRNPKSGRPAFPVIAGTLSSLGSVDLFRLAVVLPSVMAVVVGLAAGAFVAGVLRRPPWEMVVVALIVALSPFVIRLMNPEGYLDNMFAAAVFLAAAIPIAVSMQERSALVPAIFLLGAGATIHWAFFGFMAATLLLCAAAFLPASWRLWRRGESGLLDTPTARLGETVLGGGALGAGIIYVLLGNAFPSPRLDVSEFAKKLRQDLRRYGFAVSLPAAALGGIALADASRRRGLQGKRARFMLAFLLSWCGVVVAGYLARKVLHLPVPAHRFLAFALAIPILGVLALTWIARLISRFSRPLAAIAVVAAVALTGLVAYIQWSVAAPHMEPAKIRDAAMAASYLEAAEVPADRAVVFVIGPRDFTTAGLMVHMVRAALPPDRIRHAYFYVGSGEDFLARRPMDTAVSRSYFRRMGSEVYAAEPVAVIPSSYNADNYRRWVARNPDTEVGSRVAVVQGPAPPGDVPPPRPPTAPLGGLTPFKLAAWSVGSLVVLWLVGLGWSLALLGRWLRRPEILAVAPAVGVAALMLGGAVIDRLGFRLVGVPGALTPIAVALLGWVLSAVLLRGRTRSR